MRRWMLVVVLLGFAAHALAQSSSTQTLDGRGMLAAKVVGNELWTIHRDSDGNLSGIATNRDIGKSTFLWCRQTSWDGTDVGLYCFVQDTCFSPPCNETWKVVGDVTVPVSIFDSFDAPPAPPPARPHRSFDDLLGAWSFTPQDDRYCFARVNDDMIEVDVGGSTLPGFVHYQPRDIYGQSFTYGLSAPAAFPDQLKIFYFNRWSAESIGGVALVAQNSPRGYYLVSGPDPFLATRSAAACPAP